MRFPGCLSGTTRTASTLLALFLAISACSKACAQATIHIPQDQPTIQAGIDAANNGDTVLVSPGTYTVNLDFKGKAITLTTGATSYTAAAVGATTLTPADVTLPIVEFQSEEGLGSVLNGFTLTDGTAVPDPSSVVYFTDDFGYEASVYGAASTSNDITATPTITNNRFVQGWHGLQVAGGEIAGNYFTGFTSAMFIGGGHVHDNLFENNPNAGIGIYGGLFERNVIRNNSVIPADNEEYFLSHELIGISSGVFRQNLVYGNHDQFILGLLAEGYGAPIAIVAENTFADNTVSVNAAPTIPNNCGGDCAPLPVAAQILFQLSQGFAHTGNQSLIVNNIFATSSPGPDIYCPALTPDTDPPATDTLQFDHNLFNASSGPIFDSTCRRQIMTSGNVTADPLFVNAAGNDYHLSQGSPAIDTGTNSLLAELSLFGDPLTVDYDGKPRPVDATALGYPVLDRGAFEFTGTSDGQPTSLLLTPSRYTPFTSQNVTFTATLSSALGPPQGIVTFQEDGVKLSSAVARADGTTEFTLIAPTASGVHEFEADYGGLHSFPPAKSLKLVLNFSLSEVQLQLRASPRTAAPGQAILLTVVATANDGTVPSPIVLTDSGTPLATLTPDTNGFASLSVTTFTPGTHTILATYSGVSTEAPATASAVVTIDDFTIALQPPTVAISGGMRGHVSVLLTSVGSFANGLNLTAGAAPQYVTFSFSPATVPLPSAGTATSVLIISTGGAQLARLAQPPGGIRIPLIFAVLIALPLALKRRRFLRSALLAFLACALLSSCVACRTITIPLERAVPGTYVIPVTATDPSTGLTHSVNLTVVITS